MYKIPGIVSLRQLHKDRNNEELSSNDYIHMGKILYEYKNNPILMESCRTNVQDYGNYIDDPYEMEQTTKNNIIEVSNDNSKFKQFEDNKSKFVCLQRLIGWPFYSDTNYPWIRNGRGGTIQTKTESTEEQEIFDLEAQVSNKTYNYNSNSIDKIDNMNIKMEINSVNNEAISVEMPNNSNKKKEKKNENKENSNSIWNTIHKNVGKYFSNTKAFKPKTDYKFTFDDSTNDPRLGLRQPRGRLCEVLVN